MAARQQLDAFWQYITIHLNKIFSDNLVQVYETHFRMRKKNLICVFYGENLREKLCEEKVCKSAFENAH